MVINLNQIMSVIFNVPAAVASTVVASRVVRRLTNYTNPEVFTTSNSNNPAAFRGGQPSLARHTATIGTYRHTLPTQGVHVQMETFTHEECLDEVDVKVAQRLPGDGDTDNELENKARPL
ncbi:hypothetical protein H0H87_011934 [Tephrocybe sp. NHM501043]|nr:hypothetical protein H0H87_011934 [Tephrocybe sp. NHM501043]